jgi:hypothetical protein
MYLMAKHRATPKPFYPLSVYIRMLKNRYYGFWKPNHRQKVKARRAAK